MDDFSVTPDLGSLRLSPGSGRKRERPSGVAEREPSPKQSRVQSVALSSLPEELWREIIQYLDCQGLTRLECVSRRFRHIVGNSSLYKSVCLKEGISRFTAIRFPGPDIRLPYSQSMWAYLRSTDSLSTRVTWAEALYPMIHGSIAVEKEVDRCIRHIYKKQKEEIDQGYGFTPPEVYIRTDLLATAFSFPKLRGRNVPAYVCERMYRILGKVINHPAATPVQRANAHYYQAALRDDGYINDSILPLTDLFAKYRSVVEETDNGEMAVDARFRRAILGCRHAASEEYTDIDAFRDLQVVGSRHADVRVKADAAYNQALLRMENRISNEQMPFEAVFGVFQAYSQRADLNARVVQEMRLYMVVLRALKLIPEQLFSDEAAASLAKTLISEGGTTLIRHKARLAWAHMGFEKRAGITSDEDVYDYLFESAVRSKLGFADQLSAKLRIGIMWIQGRVDPSEDLTAKQVLELLSEVANREAVVGQRDAREARFWLAQKRVIDPESYGLRDEYAGDWLMEYSEAPGVEPEKAQLARDLRQRLLRERRIFI